MPELLRVEAWFLAKELTKCACSLFAAVLEYGFSSRLHAARVSRSLVRRRDALIVSKALKGSLMERYYGVAIVTLICGLVIFGMALNRFQDTREDRHTGPAMVGDPFLERTIRRMRIRLSGSQSSYLRCGCSLFFGAPHGQPGSARLG
jgi:hypothetical protein